MNSGKAFTGERRIKVLSYDNITNKILFDEYWFVIDDTIRNQRTNKDYIVDFEGGNSKVIGVIAKDEFRPYDIRENDFFYINRG